MLNPGQHTQQYDLGRILFFCGIGVLALAVVLLIVFIIVKPKYRPETTVVTMPGQPGKPRNGYPTDPLTIRREAPTGGAAATVPVAQGTVPLTQGTVPLAQGTVPLTQGTVPLNQAQGTVPLEQGTMPLYPGQTPQQQGTMPLYPGQTPQQQGTMPLYPGAAPPDQGTVPLEVGAAAPGGQQPQQPPAGQQQPGSWPRWP